MTTDKPGKSRLITEPNIPDPDGFYERLIAAHRNLDDEQSAALKSRLILLLANHMTCIRIIQSLRYYLCLRQRR